MASKPVERRLVRQVPVVRSTVAASVALGLVSTAAVVVQAVALGSLLAGAMPGAHHPRRGSELLWLAAALFVRGLAALVGELLARFGAARTKNELRSRLLGAALSGAPSGRGGGAGDVATLAGRGLDALDVYVGRCLPDFVLAGAAPLALAVAVGILDWVSCVVIVIALCLFPLFGALVGKASASLAAERWRQVTDLGRQVVDVFEGLAVLKAFGRSARQRERIRLAGEALRRASLDTLRVAFLSALVLDELASVSVALVAVPLGLRLVNGTIHLSAALAVLIIAPEVFLPLRRASAEFHQSAEGLAAAAKVMDVIGEAPAAPVTGRAPKDPAEVNVSLESVGLSVSGRIEPVLSGLDLTIAAGEKVVLVGPNGAGKSTIMSLLLGLTTPSSGLVTVGGDDLQSLDLRAWRRRIAYLPEHPTLIAGTLADNLRLAEPEASDTELVEALIGAGAGDLLLGLEQGLDTRIGEGGRPTSAGERQRIAVARILLRRASLFLLDEPTVHLDSVTEALVVAELARRLQGRSALIVTHRRAVLDLADRVIDLGDAALTASPSPSQLLQVPT